MTHHHDHGGMLSDDFPDRDHIYFNWGAHIMSFTEYLIRNYEVACDSQRKIAWDQPMIERLRERNVDVESVVSWMREYSLFQGIDEVDRVVVASAFIEYVKKSKRKPESLTYGDIEGEYQSLFNILHEARGRAWVSAASKLLWCLYPNDIVIYDKFVYRSVVVLQCLEKGLGKFPRVGEFPKIKNDGLSAAVSHYMNFQSIVKCLQSSNQKTLDRLRLEKRESYPYDIRIIDKLLWMLGNAK